MEETGSARLAGFRLLEGVVIALGVAALFQGASPAFGGLHGVKDTATFIATMKCIALVAVVAHGWWRLPLVRVPSFSRPGLLLVFSLTATLALVVLTTPQIDFGMGKLGAGYGDDGKVYGYMTEHFAWEGARAVPPYSGRFLAPMLVAYSGLDTFLGYKLLSVLSFIGCCLLLWLIGDRFDAPPFIKVTVVLLFALTKFGLRFWIYYPVLTDGLGTFFLFLGVYAVLTDRLVIYVVALVLGLACRENLIVLVPFHLAYVLRIPEKRKWWARYLALQAIPIAALLVYKLMPVFEPDGRYSVFDVMARWGKAFLREPARQHLLLTAHVNTLGVLAMVPILYAREVVTFVRSAPEWFVYSSATLGLSILGGFDYDRFALWQVPPLAVFLLAGRPSRSFSISWLAVLVAIQLVASEIPFRWESGKSFYVSRYAVYSPGTSAFAGITVFTLLLVAGCFVLKWRHGARDARAPSTRLDDTDSS